MLCSILLVIYGLFSFRALGLHIRGVEENSRSKREGIFQDDECIVKINDAELLDKSFSQWVSELKLFCFTFWSAFSLYLLTSFPSCRVTLFLDLSFHVMVVKTSMVSIVVLCLWLYTLGLVSKAEKHSIHGFRALSAVMVICWALFAVCSWSPSLTLHYCTLSCWLEICYPNQSRQDPTNHLVFGQFSTYNVRFVSVSVKPVTSILQVSPNRIEKLCM